MKKNRWVVAFAVLLLASLACSLFSRDGNDEVQVSPPPAESVPGGLPSGDASPENIPTAEQPSGDDSDSVNSEFPIPPNVENLMELGDGAVNYQTSMELDEVVAFYREGFNKVGYQERDIITVINDTTFSIVWDGHPSGKAIVVQGVDLGNGTVNVNVRFEDV